MSALAEAALRLALTLMQENTALLALDLAGATRFLTEKNAAFAAFTLAQRSFPADDAGMRLVAENLMGLVAENRRLLERGILVQGRVIGTIARAAPRAFAQNAPGYGRDGGVTTGRRLPAVALSANA